MLTFERSKKNRFELNITPLIDIVFLLLIFFMLTSSFMKQGMDINLPEVESSEKQKGQGIMLHLECPVSFIIRI